MVGSKIDNNIKDVFIHDRSNKLKTLNANQSSNSSTTIVAQEGIIRKKMVLFKGQIISTNKRRSQK